MRIAVLTGSLSRLAGGTYSSIRRPMQELARQFPVELGVFGVRDRFSDADLPAWKPLKPSVFPRYGPTAYDWSPGMWPAVRRFRPDLINVHGIWMHCSVVSLKMLRKTGTPHVVHLHGMLDPWAVRRSGWKKRLSGWLYEREHLRTAACLRALCEPEARAVREYGYRGRLCMIPNGIDLHEGRIRGPCPWSSQVAPENKVLLFLSRIHEKKNLLSLIRAWATSRARDPQRSRAWTLVVAGWDTTGHEPTLRRLVDELEVEDSVKFVGPLFENAKEDAYGHASAFVLPSLSEGLPVTVLEAWSHSLPVVMTSQCNLPEGFTSGAAIRVDTDAPSILSGLEELMAMGDADRQAMGARGRALVAARFRWDAIAREMQLVNEWLLGGGSPPPCAL